MKDWSRAAVVELMAECGRIALSYYERPRVSIKDDRTVVTEADHAVERRLERALEDQRGGSYLIGEETVAARDEAYIEAALGARAWIVDPIDGTAPYSRHIPTWGISLGLARGGRLQEGAVLLPTTGEIFVSEGSRVYYGQVDRGDAGLSDITDLRRGGDELDEQGIVAITQEMAKYGRVDIAGQVQTLGTAVIPLTYLCLGRYEGYVGRLKLWDFAGSLPLVLKCGLHARVLGGGWVDGVIGPALCHTSAGHPRRWRVPGPLVVSRSRAIVETLCSVITTDHA